MFRIKFIIFLIVLFPAILLANKSQWSYWIKKGERLKNQKKYHEAKKTTHKALKIAIKDFGEKHINTGYTLLIYGNILGRLKEFDKGEQSLRKAMVLYKNYFGKENKNVAIILGAMANVNYMRGDYIKSEELSKKALEMADKVRLNNPNDMINILVSLAKSYRKNGKYYRAELIYRKLIKIEKKLYGGHHSKVLISMNNLGLSYLEQKKFRIACKLFNNILKKELKLNKSTIAITYNNLAHSYMGLKKYKKAKYFFYKSLFYKKKKYGNKSIEIVSNLHEIALFYYEITAYSISLDYCLKILKLMNKKEPNHSKRADVLTLTGLNSYYIKDYETVILSLQKANELYAKKIKGNYSDYIDNVIYISLSYEKQNKLEKSEQNYLNELSFLMKKIGKYHPALIKMTLNMVKLYKKMKKTDDLKVLQGVIEKIKSKLSEKSSWNFHNELVVEKCA